MRTANYYTPQEDQILIEMRAQGKSRKEICQKLNRSIDSVAKRIKVLRSRGVIGKGTALRGRLEAALGDQDPRKVHADELAKSIGLTLHSDIHAARVFIGQMRARQNEAEGTQGEPTHAGVALPHMQAAIQRYTERAERLIATGTAPSAAIDQVWRETGVRVCVPS